MSILLGGASSVHANVRLADFSGSTFVNERVWPIRVAPDNDVEPFEDGVLWPSSRITGTDVLVAMVEAPFASWALGPPGGGQSQHRIVGMTLDSNGQPLGNVTIKGYLTNAYPYAGLQSDAEIGEMTSDPGGYYEFWTPYVGQAHYLTMRLGGTPARTGMTDNNLIPAAP